MEGTYFDKISYLAASPNEDTELMILDSKSLTSVIEATQEDVQARFSKRMSHQFIISVNDQRSSIKKVLLGCI